MYNLSAFMTVNAMNNNLVGITSPIGELSSYSRTFSREVGNYAQAAYPDVRLQSFNSTTDGVAGKVPDAISNKILNLGQFLANASLAGTLSDNKETCHQAVNAEFTGVIEVISTGAMESNGQYWLPSYIFVRVLGAGDNTCRIWFSDASFRGQYDINEILVIPPVVPMDDLHLNREVALAKLRGINIQDVITREGILTGDIPETKLHSVEYDWVDKNDSTIRFPTPFLVAIYGASGINDDLIRQALIDSILAESAYGRDEWEKIYPDLFRPTEFYIGPIWDRHSLPNNSVSSGLFSPVLPYRTIEDYASKLFPVLEPAYIKANVASAGTCLKGLTFISIGNPRNREAKFRFEELWPTYIDLSTSHPDFNRVPPVTQKFIIQLIGMLVVAENLTDYSELPVGMTRVVRDGVKYLAGSYNKVMYLIAIRSNISAIETEEPNLPPPM